MKKIKKLLKKKNHLEAKRNSIWDKLLIIYVDSNTNTEFAQKYNIVSNKLEIIYEKLESSSYMKEWNDTKK